MFRFALQILTLVFAVSLATQGLVGEMSSFTGAMGWLTVAFGVGTEMCLAYQIKKMKEKKKEEVNNVEE